MVILVMKILKEKSRTYKDQQYFKYKVNIPEMVIVAARLKEGDEMEATTENGMITLRKKIDKSLKSEENRDK